LLIQLLSILLLIQQQELSQDNVFHAVLIVTCVLLMQMETVKSASSVLLALYLKTVNVNIMLRAVELIQVHMTH